MGLFFYLTHIKLSKTDCLPLPTAKHSARRQPTYSSWLAWASSWISWSSSSSSSGGLWGGWPRPSSPTLPSSTSSRHHSAFRLVKTSCVLQMAANSPKMIKPQPCGLRGNHPTATCRYARCFRHVFDIFAKCWYWLKQVCQMFPFFGMGTFLQNVGIDESIPTHT